MTQPIVVENFAANTGQFTVIGLGAHGPGPGSFAISGGHATLTAGPNSGVVAPTVAVDTANMPLAPGPPEIFVYATVVSQTTPSTGSYFNLEVGIYKDALNNVQLEFASDPTPNQYGVDILMFIGGTQHNLASLLVPSSVQPDAVGFTVLDNIVTGFALYGSAWVQLTTADVSAIYDFTAPGATTGWFAGLGVTGSGDGGTDTAVYSQLWSGPPDQLFVCDPYWSNVVLLLPFDGTNGQTTTTDVSPLANVMTFAGDATLTTTTPAFGTASLNLPDTSTAGGQNVYTPIVAGGPLDILSGSADFTIEGRFWINSGHTGAALCVFDYGNDHSGGGFNLNAAGLVLLIDDAHVTVTTAINSGAWGGIAQPSSIAPDTWHHFAVERVSGNGRVYIDGGLIAGSPVWTGFTLSGSYHGFANFGGSQTFNGGVCPGKVDEVRVTADVARYTSVFDPPGLPFSAFACGQTVPNVAELPLGTAITDITNLGLVVGTVTPSCSNTVPIGYVISTNPAIGTNVPDGTVIDITVSDGLCSPTVFLYGKFAPAAAYKPVLLVDAKGIKPRIYRPRENTTVR